MFAHCMLHRDVRSLLALNAVVFVVFLTMYWSMGFGRHFACSGTEPTFGKCVYFAIMNHTATGSNDIVPSTDVARVLAAVHVTVAWSITAVLAVL